MKDEKHAEPDGQSRVSLSKSSKFYSLLGADTGVKWVLDFGHLGDQVGGFDECGWRVAAGHDDVQCGLGGTNTAKLFKHFSDRQEVVTEYVNELIEH